MSYEEYYQKQLRSEQLRILIERNAWRSRASIGKVGKAKDGVRLANLLSVSSLRFL
tara:strand:- start:345 stop:512 length:168 start_codon:yes stop_codon:yes gene_type:complete